MLTQIMVRWIFSMTDQNIIKSKLVKVQAWLKYDLPNLVIKIWYVIFQNTFVTSLSIKRHLHESKVILRSRKSNFLLLWTFNSDIIRSTIQYVRYTQGKVYSIYWWKESTEYHFESFSIYTNTTYKHRSENLLRFYSPSPCSFYANIARNEKNLSVLYGEGTICVSVFSAMNRTVYTSTNFVTVIGKFSFSENCFININRKFNNTHIYEH